MMWLDEVGRTRIAAVGGKGANLGELRRIEGVRVPDGFCITTAPFTRVLAQSPAIARSIDELSRLKAGDRDAIRTLSASIRRTIEALDLPEALCAEIRRALAERRTGAVYAVRSSATAEDLPSASFAGQQDTFLNVVGADAVLQHVRRCWASLFTERAVTYRMHNGIDHRRVAMAVVVQELVRAEVAGVLFTADPVTADRRVASIEAAFGLGEALVSGLVDADVVKVRDGAVVERAVATKALAIRPAPAGGAEQRAMAPVEQDRPALTDAQALRLADLGRRIEAHFGCPQDIEWCLVGEELWIVQSRPITTLFPIPAVDDGQNHVYVSVGHQQMMTDAMRPLGISVWQLTARRPMFEAGGRLFVDVAQDLASPATRERIVEALGKSDPLIGTALTALVQRDGFLPEPAEAGRGGVPAGGPSAAAPPAPIETDPAIVAALVAATESSLEALARDIEGKSGTALLELIRADLQQDLNRRLFDPRGLQVIMAAMEAAWWLEDRLQEWLGEGAAVDTLTQAVPYNVTSEMGLALLDVADVIRPFPEVVAFLEEADDDGFLDELPALAGGREARDAIQAFLQQYGMRCVGEIDITRPRWSERPATLLPMLLGNVRTFAPGEAARRVEQGRRAAAAKERELLERLRALPDGAAKADEAKRMIARVRTFTGFREYPKYGMVSRYWIYKQALLAEAERLVRAGVLADADDLSFLRFEEVEEVARTGQADEGLIRERREAFASYRALMPPRVFTSDGEIITGTYGRRELPPRALAGLAVSAGMVEGRARVVLDPADATLEPGDILVTRYTDPSWTPLFLAVAGLVTEVGGRMTHGAVIAREYGLPAVVGIERATDLIEDGQRIRLHGTAGYVELLG